MLPNKVIGIVGAGIGGISAGVALSQAGFRVKVFEKAGQLRETGAGVSLWPNGVMILSQFGLLSGILRHGQVGTHFLIREQSGKLLMNISTARAEQPTVCLHRGDLLRELAEAAPPECFRLNHELTGIEFAGERVRLHFRNQDSFECDGVVGADGIHSRLRGLLSSGRRKLANRGYTVFRGLAHTAALLPPGCNGESWGAGCRFGILAIGKNKVCWYATTNHSVSLRPAEESKRQLQQVFESWHDPIPQLLDMTDPCAILATQASDLGPLRQGGGLLTLLGDAAHVLTPNLGQGACIALEDAFVLAHCLRVEASVSAAFRRYEALRFPHVRSAVLRSRWLGEVGQWENCLAILVRNFITRCLPAQLFECHATCAGHLGMLIHQMSGARAV